MAWRCVWLVVLWSVGQWAWAATVAVPDALKPWQDWALHGEHTATCPFYFADFKYKQCAWPGRLSVTVTPNAVQFSQDWELFAESDLPLPGSDGYWPLDVEVNGNKALVVERQGVPQLRLPKGRYQVSGSIPFTRLPESLLIPPRTALVKLWRDGALIAHPQLDRDGRLWLVERQQPVEAEASGASEDKLSLRVFRRLQDDIPFRLNTVVELEVGGKPREMLLGKVLFDQFVPRSFDSPLPARIEADGRLRVQLRPGQWTIRLDAHRNGAVEKVQLETAADAFWPEEEVWVIESMPALRQIRVEGVESIDPHQTALPDAWKSLPAYRLQAGEAMTLVELRRGDPQPSPNQLSLERELWLDFDGGGFTVQDRLNGVLYRDWRLTANPQLALGSLELNGQPQVITLLEGTPGVEVRQGQLAALALSRIAAGDSVHHRTLASAGWQHDVDRLSARVQMPPGWRVFTVTGVDSAHNTWTGSWSVWDIFIVLIAIVAVVRLRGVIAGVICALALLLIYPEAPEFLYLWLNLIAVMAILFMLPEGKLRRFINLYGTAAALVLALWLLSFMVEQARLGLYPQLHQPWVQMGDSYYSYSGSARDADFAVPAAAPAEYAAEAVMSQESSAAALVKASRPEAKRAQPKIERMDPNLAAQTGPGRPNWQWIETTLYWSGPVTQAESFELYLLTPWENRLLAWLRVLLGVLMLVSVIGVKKINGQWKMSPWRSRIAQPAAVVLIACLGLTAQVPEANASDLPDAALLQELKQRLLKEQDCTPACIGIERLYVALDGQRLTLRFSAHALQSLYWPLPDSQQQWRIDGVVLNGEPHLLRRPESEGGQLQVMLPAGRHDLQLTGEVGARAFQLTFPLLPHNIAVQAPGWDVRGVENGRLQSNALYFEPHATQTTRTETAQQKQLTPDPVPPFVSVRRQLRLGLNWYLETSVQRIAPQQGGITLEIPLLPGESVTSQTLEVENGKVRVHIKPGQGSVTWYSALDKTSRLTLVADSSGHWSEQWIVDPSPLWHVQSEGIAPVKETGVVNQWQPRWQPYPGEQLTLNIHRPEAQAGATTTIDQVQQIVTPGQRESRHQVRFHLISSKGSEQRIDLPPGSRITQVKVNDESRAVDEDSQRVIVPVNPGQHWVDVEWRETVELSTRVNTPTVNLNAPYVNHSINLHVPDGRWVLFAGGPAMGPAILFWGVLIVTIVVAFALGRLRHLPVKTWHWVLLVLGLCAGWIQLMIFIVLWFVLMEKRSKLDPQRMTRTGFNLMQLGLALLSVGTFFALVAAIPNGLLGTPDMGVVGNGSSQHKLNWFVDRGDGALSQAWFISIPLWIYRGLMLVWSLWLALKLLSWLKWGWQAFTHEGYWRSDKIQKPDQAGPAS